MFTIPDPDGNAALRDALFESAREIIEHVTFDFANDGEFDHEYSDLSSVLVDVDLERATLKSDLPDAVNTIQGFSSAELTLTLQGSRNSDERKVYEVLSPFVLGGPFFNTNLTGTDIRYWKTVETLYGPVEIRQFTGVIRDIQFDRDTETVTIICSDVMRWINTAATLPHWAVDNYRITDWATGAARPINAAWVVGELLRQSGTPIGPMERSDVVMSASGMGSLLLSHGHRYQYSGIFTDFHRLPPSGQAPWEQGMYGPCLKSVIGTGYDRIQATNTWSGNRTIYVPVNGTSNGPVNIGMSMWSKSNGNTTNRPHPASVGSGAFYPDGAVMNLGLEHDASIQNVNMNVGNNGQVFVTLYIPALEEIHFWVWNYQPTGWHYYDLNWRFRNNSITPVLTIDGVTVAPASGTAVGHGFVYDSTPLQDYDTPTLYLIVMDPAQHFQVYAGNDSAVFIPGQQHPLTTKDDLPWIDFGGCLAELSFMPEVWNESAWEILQRVAAAEFAGIYTNEWGQLVWKPHIALRLTAEAPASEDYTLDNIMGMITNPSLDQYKNEVNIAYTDKRQLVDNLWQPEGWQSFNVPDDGDEHFYGPFLVSDIIDMQDMPEYDSGFPLEDVTHSFPYDLDRYSKFAATYVTNLTKDGQEEDPGIPSQPEVEANVWVHFADDQRSFILRIEVMPDSRTTGLWIGAKCVQDNMDEPETAMELWGKKYSEETVGWYTDQNDDEVAEFGRYALILEKDDWRQTFATAAAIAPELLADTINPVPVVTGLSIPSDPRLQIGDTINLHPGSGVTGQVKAQIVGIRRGARSSSDSIDVRIVVSPTSWILGEPGASELGVTTVLGD